MFNKVSPFAVQRPVNGPPHNSNQIVLKLDINNHSVNAYIAATREDLTDEDVNRIVDKILEQKILHEHGINKREDILSLSYTYEPQYNSDIQTENLDNLDANGASCEDLGPSVNGQSNNVNNPDAHSPPQLSVNSSLPKQGNWRKFWKEKLGNSGKDVTDVFLDVLSLPHIKFRLKKAFLSKTMWTEVVEIMALLNHPVPGCTSEAWAKCKHRWMILKKRYSQYITLQEKSRLPSNLQPYSKYMLKMKELSGDSGGNGSITPTIVSIPGPCSGSLPLVEKAPSSDVPTICRARRKNKKGKSRLLSFMKVMSARDERRHRELMFHMRTLEAQNERLIRVLELLANPYVNEENQEYKQQQELLTYLKKFTDQHDKIQQENELI